MSTRMKDESTCDKGLGFFQLGRSGYNSLVAKNVNKQRQQKYGNGGAINLGEEF